MARRKAKGAVRVWSDIPADELIDSLVDSLDRNELLGFIRELDRAAADYEFTQKLARHFARELAEEDASANKPTAGEALRGAKEG